MKLCFTLWLACVALLSADVLKFANDTQEIKAELTAKLVKSEFHFKNVSSETVTIRQADAGCSCLVAEISGGKLTYAPGESGTIRTTFEVGSFQGVVDKPIHIWFANDPDDKPSQTIHLKVHVPVIISIEPKSVKWEVGGKTTAQKISVKMDYEKPVHVIDVSTSSPDFTVKLITAEEGKEYAVEVTPKQTSSPGLAIIRIETDVDVPKQKVQQAFGVVRLPIKN